MSQALQQKKSKKEYKAKSDGTDRSSVFVSQKGTLMKRSEVREHIFRIYLCRICEKEEFEDQLNYIFMGMKISMRRHRKKLQRKQRNLIEHLDEIDEQISAHTNAWNLERLGKAELSYFKTCNL